MPTKQIFHTLDANEVIKDSFPRLVANLEALRSGFAGTEFPDTPSVGQRCFKDGAWYTWTGLAWGPDAQELPSPNAVPRAGANGLIAPGWLPTQGFPAGTRLLFQQSTAPTGWTKDTTVNDKALRVVSGTVGSGGVTGFSSIFSRTTVDSTTLVTSQMPSHRLGILAGYSDFGGTAEAVGVGFYWSGSSDVPPASSSKFVRKATRYTDYVGGNGSHTHGLDLRLAYVDIIIATKD